jgi:hypothetical protein
MISVPPEVFAVALHPAKKNHIARRLVSEQREEVFDEEYNEKSEEESLFPRFEKAGKLMSCPVSRRTCADERGSYFPLAANRGAATE